MQIRRLEWDVDAWEDYMYWHMQDKKTLKRINELIKDMLRHPFDGKGKPEPLKRNLHSGAEGLMEQIELYTQSRMKRL